MNYNIQSQRLSLVSEATTLESSIVKTSDELVDTLRSLLASAKLDINYVEHFVMIGLNNSGKIKVFAHISTGGITGTMADRKVIFSHALLSACTAIAICHNHPSGNLKPSEADIRLTDNIKEGCKIMDINFMDHIILTEDSYYSFTESYY